MVFVTAEIGINHNGSVDIAKKLIEMAKNAKCDAVKFQKRTVEKVYSKEVLDAPRESPWGTTTREQKMGLEFGKDEYDQIDDYCKKIGIDWFVSCWDIDSQLFIRKYNCKYNKVASPMLTNIELLKIIAEEKKHTFIGTGMSTIDEIRDAVKIFQDASCPFELMHSNSTYPTKLEETNIKCIETLRNEFKCDVGYSGHESVSYLVCVCAAVLGATSIERHITLDRSMYGSDQAASLEFAGLDRMVRNVKEIETILGDGVKRVWDSEVPIKKKLRGI
ncbi:Pseudaminic acid synthase protein [Marine Group I thaumarchaeote SCGC AAA799-E16]|uniref:Pseudaminic acid synthase protein n=2 Tax=Marine Group I TaxID=905826 RepID=A0A087S262_9ARCH|nr:Pseudaminic acid synthase protein [Marine Group I thaumarchaeote SCGC AAA799-E16]KFM19816.1 Pseudaminic acid synthase protein [Marine Group I thaumarchaeote SCGC RSA3]